MSAEEFREIALSFPATVENPHFERVAFKIINKRIFATLHEKTQVANIKLSSAKQKEFCNYGNTVYPVPNKWGLQGWTTFELQNLTKELIMEALNSAYNDALKSGGKKKG